MIDSLRERERERLIENRPMIDNLSMIRRNTSMNKVGYKFLHVKGAL